MRDLRRRFAKPAFKPLLYLAIDVIAVAEGISIRSSYST
jgi:hypothetical protein